MSKKLIEAALFMSSKPLSADEIARITAVPAASVEKRLCELQREYAEKGVEIIRNPEGWHMRVKPDLLPKVAHLTPYSDLKDGHKRTLALVVYREPAKQSDIVHIQGNKAYNYIKFLRKKGLVKAEKEGRTVKLSLTKEFERYFGLEKAKIRAMLHQAMEAEKTKAAEEKPAAEAKAPPLQKAEAPKATPPVNVQYIEVKPAAKPVTTTVPKTAAAPAKPPAQPARIQTAARRPFAKKTRKKARKLPPAARIGTRRPGS